MKNVTLLIIALFLAVLFFPIGILYTLLNAVREGSAGKVFGYLSKTCLSIALSVDTLGNTVCRDMLNGWLRKYPGYPFGDYRETVSRVLGKNEQQGTLTNAGRLLSRFLNARDPGHTSRAAKD